MKTIFAKYNSERLPKYQIVTKIVEDENNNRFALKQAMSQEAHEHIDEIFSNYDRLTARYSINFVKPHKTDDGILFEMAKGRSLESLLLESLENNDKESFTKYINKFLDFVDGMVSKRGVAFEPCEAFIAIFGEWETSEPQDIIEVANIDLIFGNIFVENDVFTLIDYEWVFDFDIPKSYVVWRSFYPFYVHYLQSSLDSCYKGYVENLFDLKQCINYEENFYNYVFGEKRKHFLSSKVGKQANFINLENKTTSRHLDYFIQLFIEDKNGISEENSIKIPVAQNNEIQELTFDLTGKQNIKTLRLDPLNECCVIELESLHVKKENEIIDLVPYLQTNAEMNHAKAYFFVTDDSQIYFEGISSLELQDIKALVVTLSYKHVGKDALHVSVKQTKTELDQTKTELDQTKTELDQTKTELDQTKNTLSWKITKPLRVVKKIING